MSPSKPKPEPLHSQFISVDEMRPVVEYAGRGRFDSDLWWQGRLIQPCFILLESGTFDGYTAHGNFVAPARSLICFRPAMQRVWGVRGPATMWEIALRFAPPPQHHLVPWLADVGPLPLFVPLGDLFDRARKLFELMYAELPRTTQSEQLRVRAAVFELLAIVREVAIASHGGADPQSTITPDMSSRSALLELDAWQRARLRLEGDLREPITIETIAREFDVTADYFTRRFRRRFGMSPHTCRTRAKLREALRMLRHSDEKSGVESVKVVAYRLGFTDPKAFARLFKRHLGLNPSEIAREVAENGDGSAAAQSQSRLFPDNTHVLPADRETIQPFAEQTYLVSTAPPPFTRKTIIYRRPR